jgi:hypothetical protein
MGHINANDELDRLVISSKSSIKAAKIQFGDDWMFDDDQSPDILTLYPNFTLEEYVDFLQFMNREYGNGYGSQFLFGTIWFEDGTWAERGEYDGSEWWEHHKLPELPVRE